MRNLTFFFWALLLVDGVFGVDVTVSVMEGDSVSLNPHTEIPEDTTVQWLFGDTRIAQINKTVVPEEKFRGKLKLDHQTGSLTITNITPEHAGLYKLQIRGTTETYNIFRVTVTGKMTKVSVKEEESITIHTGLIEIKGYDLILWKFKEQLIAEINKGTNQLLTHDTSDKRFNGRLQLSEKSGSLLISDSRTTDAGVYHLNMISTSHTVQRTISVTVSGVFGVEKVNVTVSVMEGDSVTLKPLTEIPVDDSAEWWFDSKTIANKKAAGLFNTSEGADERFKDRLKLDHQTGSLTITNITPDHTGLYELQIRGSAVTSKLFRVAVSGKMKTVSVKEEEPIILYTGVIEIQGYDLILWKFKEQLIAEINKGTNQFLTHDTSDKRFKGRLQMDHKSGDLTIRGSRTTDSGDYHLNMNSSTHTLKRTISVTVSVPDKQTPDPGLSSGAVGGIVGVLLLVFVAVLAAVVIYIRRKNSEPQRGLNDAEKNGTSDPLNDKTPNSDDL